jgi:hypothetical protein
MNPRIFLLLNLALGFYNVGTIWAMEVDIFRSWKLVRPEDFRAVQDAHWKKLPYWIFAPVGLALIGSIILLWYHPAGSPVWAILGTPLCQLTSLILTAIFWGRWQAKLSQDPLGSRSPYLRKILSTHWLRTALITASGGLLLVWAIIVL